MDFTNYETNIFEELHLSKPCAKMTVIAKTESNYFNGITFTVDLISNLKMIKSIWEGVGQTVHKHYPLLYKELEHCGIELALGDPEVKSQCMI